MSPNHSFQIEKAAIHGESIERTSAEMNIHSFCALSPIQWQSILDENIATDLHPNIILGAGKVTIGKQGKGCSFR